MTDAGGSELGTTRQEAIDALCEHFANDVLSVEEFERRVDQAHRAESTDDLRKLLSDLPSGEIPALREEAGEVQAQSARPTLPASRVKERGFLLAALGGVERKGRWIPARQTFAFALMGGVVLDFREALLPPGPTEVWLFTAMGGAEIIVPPGLDVESDGIAILGGFDHTQEASLNPDPDAPVLRLRGLALLGGVEVKIRNPGETAREAKRRRRLEKKEKRKRLKRGSGE